jgi:hypothetical protein
MRLQGSIESYGCTPRKNGNFPFNCSSSHFPLLSNNQKTFYPWKIYIKSFPKTNMSNQSDRSATTKKSSVSPPPQACKKWFLPKDRSSYVTFIDHGCKLDAKGYPLYPNGGTTFVQDPTVQTFRNFGSVGFTKTMSVEKTRAHKWNVKRIYCLGVMC